MARVARPLSRAMQRTPSKTTMNTTTEITPALPARTSPIVSNAGRSVGQRFFAGSIDAGTAKQAGRELGLKGNALKAHVSKALSCDAANRKLAAFCFIEAAHAERNLLPDV